MKHKTLGKKEIKEYNEMIRQQYGIDGFFTKDDLVALVDERYIVRNKQVCFFIQEGRPIPTLKLLEERQMLKTVTVDMGALKFLIKGADIFRPGVVECDDGIIKDELVCVVDKNNKKPVAIGNALMDSATIKTATQGKVVTNIHHRGDDIWSVSLETKD